jgi:hypothetical protein
LSGADLSNAAHPFGRSREIEIGYARVRASRITYVGELGWELYVSSECVADVYERLLEAGEPLGLKHAGYHAMAACRVEKGYRHWGHDIADEDTPLEAGLGFTIAWDKPGGFRGREALLRQRAAAVIAEAPRASALGMRRRESAPLLYHEEPIVRDGRIVGGRSSRVRSAIASASRWAWAMYSTPRGSARHGSRRVAGRSKWPASAIRSESSCRLGTTRLTNASRREHRGVRASMKTQAAVTVIGGGAVGCSALYHLTQLGVRDAVLIERDELTAGSTWHAAGNCPNFTTSWNLMKLQRYSTSLYASLAARVGYEINHHITGSLRLAHTPARVDEFRHVVSQARAQGMRFRIAESRGAARAQSVSCRPTDCSPDSTILTTATSIRRS